MAHLLSSIQIRLAAARVPTAMNWKFVLSDSFAAAPVRRGTLRGKRHHKGAVKSWIDKACPVPALETRNHAGFRLHGAGECIRDDGVPPKSRTLALGKAAMKVPPRWAMLGARFADLQVLSVCFVAWVRL